MRRNLTSLALAAALAAALVSAAPNRAYAHDQSGLGIGANVTLGGISGLNLNYWLASNMMLEFMVATSLNFPRQTDGSVVGFTLGGSVGFFGVLTGNDTTNLMLGGRFAVLAQINTTNVAEVGDDAVTLELDVPLRVEHWFDSNFAINAQVGFALALFPDVNCAGGHVMTSASGGLGVTSGLFGGAGFTYYFDGAAPGHAPPADTYASPPPSSSPPPSTSTGTTTQTGEAAPWEQ